MSHPASNRFVHQRLDAYRVALQLFKGVEQLAAQLPRGHADLRDQMRRAAGSTVRHIAEGANRTHPRDKAARFMIARGECGECDATLEMLHVIGLASASELAPLRSQTDRVAAMLVGLINKERSYIRNAAR